MSLVELSRFDQGQLDEGATGEVVGSIDQLPTIEQMFTDAVSRSLNKENKIDSRGRVLKAVFDIVANSTEPTADSLDMAYSASQLLELFKDRGILRGEIVIDQADLKWPSQETTESHAWVRYTPGDDEPISDPVIIDADIGVFGKLSDLKSVNYDWIYLREEEKLERTDDRTRLLLDGLVGLVDLEEVPVEASFRPSDSSLVMATALR